MTLSNMSTVYPVHSAPAATHTTNIFTSKAKLGFSIDSIVGVKRERSPSPDSPSPVRIKRSWSPPCSPDDLRLAARPQSPRSPRPRSVSPPRQDLSPLLRPPHMPQGGVSPSYLDQLNSLRALYEAKGQVPLPPTHLLAPGLMQGLHGLHRPPPSLPHFMGLPGAPMPPREYPLHPWFLNRHRFPLGEFLQIIIIFFVCVICTIMILYIHTRTMNRSILFKFICLIITNLSKVPTYILFPFPN